MKKIIDSHLSGNFTGWTVGTIYELKDGTLWRVEPARNAFEYENYEYRRIPKRKVADPPRATIVQKKDKTLHLYIQGHGQKRRVVKMRLLTPEEVAAKRLAENASDQSK